MILTAGAQSPAVAVSKDENRVKRDLISDAGSVTISIEADISNAAMAASDMQFLQFQIRNFLL